MELLQGCELRIASGAWTISTCWTPWLFADPAAMIRDEAEAIDALRAMTRSCVGAWAGCFDKILLSISGGLDSSIVAHCLAHAGTAFSSFNLVTEDPVGDERDYARTMCATVGSELFEIFRDAGRVDLRRSNASHLPRPIARSFAQEMDRISVDLAHETGATAFFGGGGGDSLFCYLQSAAPSADRLLVEGLGLGAIKTIRSMSIQAECSFLTVAAMAVRRAWCRTPAFRIPADTPFLSEQAIHLAAPVTHPWLETPAGALPGKAAHIANLLTMQNHMEGFARERLLPNISPLMSQPLVELCLRIPSWMWSADGRNRMAARRAFAGDLPPAIVNRTGKGTPGTFEIEIFERNHALIRDMLAGGKLAAQGLLDTQAVDGALKRDGPVRGNDHRRILSLIDVEAWLCSYS
jgi:asparagine synthase (glutamine-hydrolysing)